MSNPTYRGADRRCVAAAGQCGQGWGRRALELCLEERHTVGSELGHWFLMQMEYRECGKPVSWRVSQTELRFLSSPPAPLLVSSPRPHNTPPPLRPASQTSGTHFLSPDFSSLPHARHSAGCGADSNPSGNRHNLCSSSVSWRVGTVL